MSNTLQTAGNGWEFLSLSREKYPHIGRGKCWNPITGCPKLAAGKPCATPFKVIECDCGGKSDDCSECLTCDGENIWNTGVRDCIDSFPYCYMARNIKRFPDIHKAEYRFHPNRLSQPTSTKKPSIVAVGTAGDIWGWIRRSNVAMDDYAEVRRIIFAKFPKRNHYYLFLTKYPENYNVTEHYIDIAYGTTITSSEDIFRIGHLNRSNVAMRWVIVEPCFFSAAEINQLPSNIFDNIDWVIIGAMTGPGSKDWQPSADVINLLTEKVKKAGCAVYHKKSLKKIIGEGNLLREHPAQILQWAEVMR